MEGMTVLHGWNGPKILKIQISVELRQRFEYGL